MTSPGRRGLADVRSLRVLAGPNVINKGPCKRTQCGHRSKHQSDVWPCPQGTGHPQKLESARKVLSWTSRKDAMLPKRRLYSPETHSELVV